MFEVLGRLFSGGKRKEQGPSLEELYRRFLLGTLGQRELFAALREDQVDAFCALHQRQSAVAPANEDRRLVFKRNQLDSLIENDARELKRGIIEAHGGTTISQWN